MDDIEAAALAFHRQHPGVYAELVRIARQLKAAGHKRYGIGALFEVVRFHRALATTGDFKLNNNYRAIYARVIMAKNTDLAGFFETRVRYPRGTQHRAPTEV